MESESLSDRRKVTDCNSPRDSHSFGCFFRRLGLFPESQNVGPLDLVVKKRAYKYSGVEKVAKYVILSFTRVFSSAQLIKTKEIWNYLIFKGVIITVKYLSGSLNKEANFQPRALRDSSKWKLYSVVFQMTCKLWGAPYLDLFASQVSHNIPTLHILETGSIQQRQGCDSKTHIKGYAFPPLSLVGRVLSKVQRDHATSLLVIPASKTQSWEPLLQYGNHFFSPPCQSFCCAQTEKNIT